MSNQFRGLLFFLALVGIVWGGPGVASAQDGYWDLVSNSKIDRSKSDNDWANTTLSIADGAISFSSSARWLPDTLYERYGTWTGPPGVLVPGKTLSLTLRMRNGKVRWAGAGFANGQISASFSPGGYLYL